MVVRLVLVVLTLLLAPGCAMFEHFDRVRSKSIPMGDEAFSQAKTVWVVSHGWHTGLVVRSEDVPRDIFPEVVKTQSEFVELGWGDEGFYSAEKITVPLVAKAMLVPTPSVLHLAGFDMSVKEIFPSSDIVEIQVSSQEYRNMCQFMSDTFKRTDLGDSIQLGPGLYGDSKFYRANGKYYAPKTCNVWTAKALKRAGFPVSPQLATTAEGVMLQIRRQGIVVQRSGGGQKKASLGIAK